MDLERIARRSKGPGLSWPRFILVVIFASSFVKVVLSFAGVPT